MTDREKYEDLLVRLRKAKDDNDVNDERYCCVIDTIVPELKKSEDERIKKAIKKALQVRCDGSRIISDEPVTLKEAIAWLEKQGESYTKRDVDDAYLKGVCDAKQELEKQDSITKLSKEEQNRFAKGVLTSCALSFIDYLDAHKYEGKMCVSNVECEDIENAFHNAMWDRLHRYYCKYIEKQGEQKPFVKYKVGDTIYYDSFGRLVSFVIANIVEDGTDNPMYEDKDGNSVFQNDIVEKKPAWSEDDKTALGDALWAIQQARTIAKDDNDMGNLWYAERWLKSLKDRVQPQPKQEWSEEDCNQIETIACHLDNIGNEAMAESLLNIMNKYKSCRPQKQWKPSDKQIYSLDRTLRFYGKGTAVYDSVKELLEQLKKLK